MPRPPLPGCCRVCPSLQAQPDPGLTKIQSEALKVGARNGIPGWRGRAVVMGKCSHVLSGQPLPATYIRIFHMLRLEPEFTHGGFSIQNSQVQLPVQFLTPPFRGWRSLWECSITLLTFASPFPPRFKCTHNLAKTTNLKK